VDACDFSIVAPLTEMPDHSMPDAPQPPRKHPDLRLIILLAAGHMAVDTNQGSLPAILPYLRSAHGLSYTAAGALVLVANLTSSVIQPVFGYLADRRARRWVLPLSVLCAGVGMGLLGFARDYWLMMLLLTLTGLGVAAYHPEGYRATAGVAGQRKATAISWFSVGGNLGIALGPPMITFLLVRHGLRGSIGMILPALAVAALLVLASPRLSPPRAVTDSACHSGSAASRPHAMVLLILLVAVRSWTQLGFATYIPFYYLDYLKATPETVASVLFVFLGSGAAGTLIGGPVADRWGARRFTILAFLAAIPLGLLFLYSKGVVAYVALGMFGAALVASFTTTVVLGQAYLPRNPGMASGLIVGFAIGTGGLAVTLLGGLADTYGVPTVLWISAMLPVIGFVTALFLPSPRTHP